MVKKRYRVGKNKLAATFKAERRRKEIIRLIFEAGNPRLLTEAALGKHFQVSHVQIHKDLKICRAWIGEHYGDDIMFEIVPFYKAAMKDLTKAKDWKTLGPIVKNWTDFLFNTGKLDKTPDKFQADIGITAETTLTDEELKIAAEALLDHSRKSKNGKTK